MDFEHVFERLLAVFEKAQICADRRVSAWDGAKVSGYNPGLICKSAVGISLPKEKRLEIPFSHWLHLSWMFLFFMRWSPFSGMSANVYFTNSRLNVKYII